MNLAFNIARRYLFSKKKSNAINIISIIAIIGIAIGTCSALLVTAVFNGFEGVILEMFDRFNPDVKVLPKEGKTFSIEEEQILQIQQIPNIKAISKTIEETAFFEYGDKRDVGTLKGVDDHFKDVILTDEFNQKNGLQLEVEGKPAAIVSELLSSKLQVGYQNMFEPIQVYMRAKKRSALDKPFSRWALIPIAKFNLTDEEKQKMVITSLDYAQKILKTKNKISALEIGIEDSEKTDQVKKDLQQMLGDGFIIKDRREQQSSFLKLMNVEKWVGFAILSLALLLVSFNMTGAMWMIIMEKEKDLSILKAVGLPDQAARKIFLFQGLMMSCIGFVIGILLALVIYFLQKNYGIVTIDPNMPLQSYPVEMRFSDFLPIGIVVISLGILSSLPAGNRAYRLNSLINTR